MGIEKYGTNDLWGSGRGRRRGSRKSGEQCILRAEWRNDLIGAKGWSVWIGKVFQESVKEKVFCISNPGLVGIEGIVPSFGFVEGQRTSWSETHQMVIAMPDILACDTTVSTFKLATEFMVFQAFQDVLIIKIRWSHSSAVWKSFFSRIEVILR